MKILVVRKMSALEYHYNGNHQSKELIESHKEQKRNLAKIEKILKKEKQDYEVTTRINLSYETIMGYDLVISAGGDGTVIATAAYNTFTPQLNLKLDRKSKGTLCIENFEDAIKAVLDKNCEIEKWTRQDIFFDHGQLGTALNETCIGEGLKFSKMAKYELYNGKEKEIQKNSGLVIVTGTGSTGWPSAFIPYSKNSKILKYKAILPYQGKEKGQGNYFKIKYRGHEGKVAIDTVEYDLPRDSLLEVIEAANPLPVVIPKK